MAETVEPKKETKKTTPKKVKIKVLINYLDLELNTYKYVGDEFEVSPKRAKVLVDRGIVKII